MIPHGTGRNFVEEVSPNGNVCAFVEQDDRACYFYLHGNDCPAFGMKSCWVRNLGPAPEHADVGAMREGLPPMLERKYCRYADGAPPFKTGELSIIWAEEGDAAALTSHGEIIAVIPSWSGLNGFSGYARDCTGESPLCWALGIAETNAQFGRYERSKEFWELWSDQNETWPRMQDSYCQSLEGMLGRRSNYYALGGGKWPPKAMLRIPSQQHVVLVTLGMSIRPQPRIETHYPDPAPYRRIELGMGLESSLADEDVKKFASYISGQTNLPWSRFTFLGHGHTLPSDVAGELSGGRLPFVLLVRGALGAPDVKLPDFHGDPVNLLWMIPISEKERRFAETNGSSELSDRLEREGVNWIAKLDRNSVVQ